LVVADAAAAAAAVTLTDSPLVDDDEDDECPEDRNRCCRVEFSTVLFSGNELELEEEEEEEEEQVDEGEELEQVAGKSGDTQEDGDVVANAKARLTAATAAVVVVLFTEAAAD